mgnify:CR=1 FL=1
MQRIGSHGKLDPYYMLVDRLPAYTSGSLAAFGKYIHFDIRFFSCQHNFQVLDEHIDALLEVSARRRLEIFENTKVGKATDQLLRRILLELKKTGKVILNQ